MEYNSWQEERKVENYNLKKYSFDEVQCDYMFNVLLSVTFFLEKINSREAEELFDQVVRLRNEFSDEMDYQDKGGE